MLNAFKIWDTIEKMGFRTIKEDCVITDTHLAWIIAVSWANLFEKKEAEAIGYLTNLCFVINHLWIPVQLVTLSRPKNFENHSAWIKKNYKKNDFKLKFKKDFEWFRMYYAHDLQNWKVTEEEIRQKFERAPEYIERSMLDSYAERLDTAVKNNNILEKHYYFVISTLDAPSDITEKSEQEYPKMNFEDENTFSKYRDILEERCGKAQQLLKEVGWMIFAERMNSVHLENIFFDAYNFPVSSKHKINRNVTAYGKIPPILEGSKIQPQINKESKLSYIENVVNKISNNFKAGYSINNTEGRSIISNNILQLLKPYSIDDSNINYLKINDQFLFTIHIDYFGQEWLSDLSLWSILSMEYYYDLSVHLIPLPKQKALLELAKREHKIERDFNERKKWKAIAEVDLLREEAGKNIKRASVLSTALNNETTNLFSTSIDVTFRATSLKELNKMKKKIKLKLVWKQIFYSEALWSHLDGFLSTLPLLQNYIAWYNRPFERMVKLLEEVRHFYPYCPQSIQLWTWTMLWLAEQGSWDEKQKCIELFDLFDKNRVLNAILAIIGNSWSGKTTFMHGFAKNQMLLWNRMIILDYLWNYIKWAEDMPEKFNIIKIDQNSKTKINPCDILIPENNTLNTADDYCNLTPEEIKEKITNDKLAELSAYFKIFLKEYYNPETQGILDDVSKETYKQVLKDIDIYKIKVIDHILLSDIVDRLFNEKNPDLKEKAKSIANMLKPYATWSYSWMFNSKTNVIVDDRSIVFYLHNQNNEMYEEIATLQAFTLSKKLIYRTRKNILVIDELHKIFRMEHREIINFFRTLIATIRNMEGWVIWMTQLLKQIRWTPGWDEFLEISAAKLYLCWWESKWKDDTDVANYDTTLSNSSKIFLTTHNQPWWAIFKTPRDQIQIRIENHPDLSMFERYKPPKQE